MARYIPQRQTIIDRTVKYMKELGTYKVQYKQVIEIYADMIYQYNVLSKQFEESGYEVILDTEKSGGKKSPILVSLENAKTYNAEIEQPKKEKSAFALLLEKQQGK